MHERCVQASVFCHAGHWCQVIRRRIYRNQQKRTQTKFVASRLDVSFLCYISVHARYALKQKLEVLLWATFVYLLVSCLGKPLLLHILLLKRMHEVGHVLVCDRNDLTRKDTHTHALNMVTVIIKYQMSTSICHVVEGYHHRLYTHKDVSFMCVSTCLSTNSRREKTHDNTSPVLPATH